MTTIATRAGRRIGDIVGLPREDLLAMYAADTGGGRSVNTIAPAWTPFVRWLPEASNPHCITPA